jgi:hypothetical protein
LMAKTKKNPFFKAHGILVLEQFFVFKPPRCTSKGTTLPQNCQ